MEPELLVTPGTLAIPALAGAAGLVAQLFIIVVTPQLAVTQQLPTRVPVETWVKVVVVLVFVAVLDPAVVLEVLDLPGVPLLHWVITLPEVPEEMGETLGMVAQEDFMAAVELLGLLFVVGHKHVIQ